MITLLFSTSDGIASWFIRKMGRSKASHCAIGAEMYGVPVIVEDTVGGVRVYPRKRWIGGKRIIGEYRFVPNMEDGLRHAIGHVGDEYDYVGLLGYFWVLMGRWLNKKWRNPLAKASAAVCSEFILELDPRREFIPEWKQLVASSTMPQDLLKCCEGGTSFVLVESGADAK